MILFSNRPAAFTLTGGQHSKTSLGGVQYEVTVGTPNFLTLPFSSLGMLLADDSAYFLFCAFL